METLEQQTFLSFEGELPSCPPAYPASQQVLPASERARQMTVGSGRQCSMLLQESSPLGRFSKILLGSSRWTSSMEYCYVWQRLDTRFGLSAFQLTQLGQSTDDNECLLLPTASASDMNSPGPLERRDPCDDDLPTRIQRLWRTPGADVQRGAMDGEKRLEAGHQLNLAEQAKTPKLWPTPRKEGYDSQGKGHGDLVYEVKNRLLPTPSATDYKGKSGPNCQAFQRGDINRLADMVSGSLNPRFVEQLMGFEVDHTDLKDWAIVSSRNKRTRSSKRLPESKESELVYERE